MGWIGLVGAEIYDSKGKPFDTIERFSQLTGAVILEVKLSENIDGLDRIQIPLEECVIKNDSISTKKSIKSILNAEKKKKKDELKEEQERFKKMLEKRRMISEPESAAPVNNDSLVSEVKSVLKEKEGPSTPADWIICPKKNFTGFALIVQSLSHIVQNAENLLKKISKHVHTVETVFNLIIS